MDSVTLVTETEVHVVSAGMQGPPGPSGNSINDAVVALDSTFSSQHVTDLIEAGSSHSIAAWVLPFAAAHG